MRVLQFPGTGEHPQPQFLKTVLKKPEDVDVQSLALTAGEILSFLPFVEPVTGLALLGITLSTAIGAISIPFLKEKTIGPLTPSGAALIGTFLIIDLLSFRGYEPSTYVGNIIISNADLLAFFLGLAVIGNYLDWDFPDKWKTFQDVLTGRN